jgi:hypothetical protein
MVGHTTHASEAPAIAFADWALRLEPFLSELEIPAAVAPKELLPDEFQVIATSQAHVKTILARGDLGSALVISQGESTFVQLSAESPAKLEELVRSVTERAERAIGGTDHETAELSVWWYSPRNGAMRRFRRVTVPRWDAVARNYPNGVAGQLDQLMQSGPPSRTGRLILWHGEPGTGKTSAVLALLERWRDWCSGQIITDPERMFLESDYLNEVLACDPHRSRAPLSATPGPSEWRLIVAEDADEYLRSDARQRSGPALGRLLNASDGILGRGTRTILLLTTNQELGRLHPAVTRPGRALAITEFKRFNEHEPQRWLGPQLHAPSQGATLAELYYMRDGSDGPGVEKAPLLATGAYL